MIMAKDYVSSGFSPEDAKLLDLAIAPLTERGELVSIDFSDVRHYTTAFFNEAFGKYLVQLGPDQYEKQFQLTNLSKVGEMCYRISFENAVKFHSKQLETTKTSYPQSE